MLYKSNETIQKSANYRFQLQHVANSKDMCPRLKNKTTSPKNATTSSPQNICTYIYIILYNYILYMFRHIYIYICVCVRVYV